MSNIRATFSINAAGTVWGAIDGDISNQTDLQDALDLKADKSELETDIEEVNTAISNLSDTVLDNYNTLDEKIDTEISNRVTANEDLQDNIDTLGETVAGNYNTLNEKIDELSDTVTDNYTELNNKILDNTADITTNTSSITNINGKIPEQASAVNQLADKNFVNSSIATNTANFIGTFNSIAELEAYSGTLTNNDYAFVATTDSVGNTLYDRYKWNGSEWLFEYELNNSSFTANQWASINSGITNTLTAQITTNQNSITNIQNNYVPNIRTINGKALNTNITLNASDVNALANTTTINDLTTTAQQNALNSGATSAKISQIATNTGNITTNANAISTINGKIPAGASSSNKLVTASALSNAVVNLANQDLSNLTETGNDRLHALKGYEDAGELLTDAEGLANVKRYAHSTFDLSKFTVVGSPNITNDGIASGFSSSNYLTLSNPLVGATNYQIDAEFTFTEALSNAYDFIFADDAGSAYGLALWRLNGGLKLKCNSTDTDLINTISLNTAYKLSIKAVNNSCTVDITANGVTTTKTVDISTMQAWTSSLWLGNRSNDKNSSYLRGSIDLKQYSITVDGVEVFNGNKTGIDTIKPDDYTVVGTPTITADGIASGFSSGSGLKIPAIFTPNTSEVYTIKFKTGIDITSRQFPFRLYNNLTGAYDTHCISIEDGRIRFQYQDGLYGSINATANTEYFLKLEIFDGRCKYYQYSNNDWILLNEVTNSSIKLMSATTTDCVVVGNAAPNNLARPFLGSIDLNAFKIYVDGNLVYQPCLKIPYTQSKTGSKIVNAVYRDRVNDMASQFGYANYYTLDEYNGNFTLPQGELYGLVGDKTLRDSYYNGVTYWELFSNRRLEQGGSCESGVEYTFPKPFADRNYVLTIPYSSKTETSFIPSATGDFIAKGTGLL